MNIFKYLAKHGPKVLRSCELKVSDPREFNDPFEFCPHVETNITAEQMEGKLQDNGFLENIYLKNSAIRQEYATAADFLKGIEHDRPRWVDFFLKRFSNRDSFLPDRFAEIAAKHVGIVCFSQISDDILMWSHYADNHRGVVIEFDESTFGTNLDVVEYSSDRPKYSPVLDVEGFTNLTRVTKRKSDHWSYEKELRLLVPWELAKERMLESGERIRTLVVPPANVCRVVLGCMADQQTTSEIKGVLSEERFKHVRLQRMVRDLTKYKLHAVDEQCSRDVGR